jgi:hypothetical protein
MKKQEIIQLAESLGFKFDYEKIEPSPLGYWIRFVSQDDSLDEKDLRWIWYLNDPDEENIKRGKYIKSRLDKKKQVQEFLKY